MCGILAVINKNTSSAIDLINACSIIRHRGPDDEGFLTWIPGENPKIWAGNDTSDSTLNFWKYDKISEHTVFKVGFGHRRLSILDLSPNGHQPMVHKETGISISFNGEIYNYLDIKDELLGLGYQFHSQSDTEVLLTAWVAWGKKCLDKLNGMFSFVILDPRNGGVLYAARDRFGVKPLYWSKINDTIIFSSEIKQIRSFKGYKLAINKSKVYQFLATGIVDNDQQTFDTNISQIPGGGIATVYLDKETPEVELDRWYILSPQKWSGTESDAIERFKQLLKDSVKLRLRADVPVGSCLSGGLDSSAIVCLVREILSNIGEHKGQETVTACYSDKRYDEWKFASDVINQTKAISHRIYPDFNRLKQDFEQLLWHQDDPFPSTSQFSQWCVFAGSADARLKVMIDGQGSDEQLCGYGGNDLSLYAGLLSRGAFVELFQESNSYKKAKGHYPIGFILGAFELNFPHLAHSFLPNRLRSLKKPVATWLKASASDISKPVFKNLHENLRNQVLCDPLPSLLRYEDRSSMAWSIESRVPFLDYRFVEFTMGLPEKFVYKDGLRKTILRKAMKGVMPDSIVNRTDKMGFVTPEEVWLKEEGTQWFRDNVATTVRNYPDYFNEKETIDLVESIIAGKTDFSFLPWRIVCFGKWMDMMKKYS